MAKGAYDQATIYGDAPLDQAKAFEAAGARWIHIVDLDGAREGRAVNHDVITRIIGATDLNIEVGGGIRTMETLDVLAAAGAARMVIGTALVRDPAFAQAAIAAYGDKLAAGIDAKSGEVAVQGWEEGSGVQATELAARMAKLGYKHLVYTDIARDGMQTGIDPEAYRQMAAAFGHPVIASGGVASVSDIEVLLACGDDCIEGIIAGRAVYEGALDVAQACALLK